MSKSTTRPILLSNQHDGIDIEEAEIENLFHLLDEYSQYKIPQGELSVVLMSDESLAKLHEQFLNDPTPTDVITFPGDSDMDFSGEICISVDRAKAVCEMHNNSLAEEITLYLVHGWLHLAGFDDIHEQDRQDMRKAEAETMQMLHEHAAIPYFMQK